MRKKKANEIENKTPRNENQNSQDKYFEEYYKAYKNDYLSQYYKAYKDYQNTTKK